MSLFMAGGFILLANDALYGNYLENSPQQFYNDSCSFTTRFVCILVVFTNDTKAQ